MTRRTTMALRVGPRLTDGRFSPELAARVTRGLKSGSMSLAYARTTTTLIGAAGTAETQSLTAPITYSGSRWLQLRMSPGVFRIAHSGHQLTAYHFGFEASGRITRTLSAVAAYDVSRQDGNFYS